MLPGSSLALDPKIVSDSCTTLYDLPEHADIASPKGLNGQEISPVIKYPPAAYFYVSTNFVDVKLSNLTEGKIPWRKRLADDMASKAG
jgi:hypothetical protein